MNATPLPAVFCDHGAFSNRNKELVAQGISNAAVGFIGGIPGAQTTTLSVLIIKEGADSRAAPVLMGLFILIEMWALQGLVEAIPQAVFTGVLIKVGIDVFAWESVTVWAKGSCYALLDSRRSVNELTAMYNSAYGTSLETVVRR